jgi:hypothetical protein
MTFLTITTLNATITPRLNIDLTHNANYRPSGDYRHALNGIDYFNLSTTSQDYTLLGRIAYTPFPAISINLQPNYLSSNAYSSTGTELVPTTRRNSFNMSGGVNVNLPVAGKGRLSGGLTRNQESIRQLQYANAKITSAYRTQTSYWSGNLQFSWRL